MFPSAPHQPPILPRDRGELGGSASPASGALPEGHGGHGGHGAYAELTFLLDLDARVHASLLCTALDTVTDLVERPVRLVLDVGAGTGSGTFRLLERFRSAEVIALDASERMTDLVRDRAVDRGVADRVRVLTADVLDSGIAPGSVDLVWSSSVFHEFGDPGAAFAAMRTVLRPGGVLAVLEMDAPPRVLPEEWAGLETRLRDAAGADTRWPDWTDAFSEAGFTLQDTRSLRSDRTWSEGAGRDFALGEIRRLSLHAAERLGPADQEALRAITSARSEAVPAVRVRGSRTLYVGRR